MATTLVDRSARRWQAPGPRSLVGLPFVPPRWKKVMRDLAFNRTRTALVVLSIAVGVFAFGTILGGPTVLSQTLNESFLAINPPSATLTTAPFDEELVEAVRRVPGVAQAQGTRSVAARIQTGPTTWQDAMLFV